MGSEPFDLEHQSISPSLKICRKPILLVYTFKYLENQL